VFYAFGHNQYNINNKKSNICHDCIHAEVDCVNQLKKSNKITPINIIVFRTNNNADKLMMAKPCQNCLNTIHYTLKNKNYNLKKLIYTDENGQVVYI